MVPPGHVTPSKVRVRRTCASRRASNGEKRARKREKKEQELEPKPWWKKNGENREGPWWAGEWSVSKADEDQPSRMKEK